MAKTLAEKLSEAKKAVTTKKSKKSTKQEK
jgi:hypothetical protein